MKQIGIVSKEKVIVEKVKEVINKRGYRWSFDYRIIVFETPQELIKSNKIINLIISTVDDYEGVSLRKSYNSTYPQASIIFLSQDSEKVFDCIGANTVGFVLKNQIDELLYEKIIDWVIKEYDEFVLLIKNHHNIKSIPYVDIEQIFLKDRRIYVKTFHGHTIYLTSGSFSSFVKENPLPNFIQPNSYKYINLEAVEAIEGHRLKIKKCGLSVIISRDKVQSIKDQFMNFVSVFEPA